MVEKSGGTGTEPEFFPGGATGHHTGLDRLPLSKGDIYQPITVTLVYTAACVSVILKS